LFSYGKPYHTVWLYVNVNVEIFSAEKSAGLWQAFRPREAVPEVDLKKHQLIQGLWSAGQRDY
jgi:hypothetical protein